MSDESLDGKIKSHLEHFKEVDLIEIRESVGRNRADENITLFLKDGADINKMKTSIDSILRWYFEEDMIDK